MSCVKSFRCVVPRFAQIIHKTTAMSIPVVRRRTFFQNEQRFCSSAVNLKRETVTVNFVTPDGTKLPAKAKVGDNLLDIVIENDLDLDGFGACEGTLACSTCHLIFNKEDYDKLPEEPTDEELDMLDLAYGLTDTSRLGCQIIVTKDMDGLSVRVPAGVADAREPF